jgi:mono/diheme cytochrome c family protein
MTGTDGLSRRRREFLLAGALAALAAPALAGPRAYYLLHCAGCHLADGRGSPGAVPSLAGTLGRIAASPAGRDYLARAPGAAQAPISDEALATVLNWLLLEFNRATLPPDFRPLTGSEVARSRARVLADPLKLRRELWPDATDY